MSDILEIFRHKINVRWGDMDALGHVNNTVYFRYMEETRLRWLDSIGYSFSASDIGPVLVNTSVDFKRPIVFLENVEIILSVKPPGNSSVTSIYTFMVAGEVVATGVAVIVWANYKQGKSVELPDLVRSALLTD